VIFIVVFYLSGYFIIISSLMIEIIAGTVAKTRGFHLSHIFNMAFCGGSTNWKR